MVRTRFAPSPTGFMHIGNLRTALYAYLYAKKNKGKFILRIEDTDAERYVEGAVETIFSTLKKAGIFHDEGPDKGEFGPYIQSQRKDIYIKYAMELVKKGGAYYCFCDKERLDTLADEKGVKRYDKHCLNLKKAEIEKNLYENKKFVIRQNMPTEGESSYVDMVFGKISVPNKELEDNILIKTDGMPTYNFANVVDDFLMGITHVIRGTEYLSSTPKYNLIYDKMGWERPRYMHLPPIMKDEQRKLSKRYGDANFEDFLQKGYLPEAIVNYIALLGWSPKGNQEKMTMQELIDAFDLDGISKSSSIFDEQKMKWLNSQYIKEMSLNDFHNEAKEYYKKLGIEKEFDTKLISELLHQRTEVFSDIYDSLDFLINFEDFDLALYEHKRMKTDFKTAKPIIQEALTALKDIEFTTQNITEALEKVSLNMDIKKGKVLYSVRVALTGKKSTPGGAIEMAELLGKEKSLKRLKKSLEMIERGE
ncbi:MAG: glutamate--tRNA ligase [Bacillota bacterium]